MWKMYTWYPMATHHVTVVVMGPMTKGGIKGTYAMLIVYKNKQKDTLYVVYLSLIITRTSIYFW